MTIKSRIEAYQGKIIDKVGNNNICPSDKEKITRISNKAFIISLIIFEGVGSAWIFGTYLPKKYGFPYSQTLLMVSILTLLGFIYAKMLQKQKL